MFDFRRVLLESVLGVKRPAATTAGSAGFEQRRGDFSHCVYLQRLYDEKFTPLGFLQARWAGRCFGERLRGWTLASADGASARTDGRINCSGTYKAGSVVALHIQAQMLEHESSRTSLSHYGIAGF